MQYEVWGGGEIFDRTNDVLLWYGAWKKDFKKSSEFSGHCEWWTFPSETICLEIASRMTRWIELLYSGRLQVDWEGCFGRDAWAGGKLVFVVFVSLATMILCFLQHFVAVLIIFFPAKYSRISLIRISWRHKKIFVSSKNDQNPPAETREMPWHKSTIYCGV